LSKWLTLSCREHILRDLQPYMCTYKECPDADALYASRQSWLAHEVDVHRRVWRCFTHSEPLFTSQDALLQHLRAEHGAVLDPAQIQEIAKRSHAGTIDQRGACPFCQSAGPFQKGLTNHMAFHMEQLACFAVPRGSGVDDDALSQEANTNTAQGGLSATSLVSSSLVFSNGPSGDRDRPAAHSGRVFSVNFSPDGKLLASASADETVRIRDVAAGGSQQILESHSDGVNSVNFSPDGKLLASASADETVRIWDVATGGLQQTLEGHSGEVLSVNFSPDGKLLASASADDETVRIWDVRTGGLQQTLEGHSGEVLSVNFSPDGKLLASASDDNTVRIWDVRTGGLQQTLEGHSGRVYSVNFSPDGKLLASASLDKTVRIWDAATSYPLQTLEGHGDRVMSITFSPNARLFSAEPPQLV
jgi:WD40 repeat protein